MGCMIWWFLLGLLIGLLLFWLIDKLFRRTGESRIYEKDNEIQRLHSELDSAQKVASESAQKDPLLDAAKFGFVPMKKGLDNLQLIEGIGPKIAGLLNDAGIDTFKALAAAEIDTLQAILEKAGARYKLANPKTWPKQAEYCVSGDWAGLKEYQDYLDGGVDLADRKKD